MNETKANSTHAHQARGKYDSHKFLSSLFSLVHKYVSYLVNERHSCIFCHYLSGNLALSVIKNISTYWFRDVHRCTSAVSF